MTNERAPTRLETLPNEILLDICKYLTARDLYRVFYGLNHRWRSIIDSCKDLHLSMTAIEYNDPIFLAFPRVIKLSIDSVTRIELRSFHNIRSLKWIHPTAIQLQQLRSFNYFPHLQHLSVFDAPWRGDTAHFHQFIFSNGFPNLQKCNLSQVDITYPWLFSPNLRAISIRKITHLEMIERVLIACPNLTRLDVHFFRPIDRLNPSTFRHVNVKTLFLYEILLADTLESILTMTPALIWLHIRRLQRQKPIAYFQSLSQTFNMLVPYLERFECDLLFSSRIDDLEDLRSTLEKLHPSFHQCLQVTKLDFGRIRVHTK